MPTPFCVARFAPSPARRRPGTKRAAPTTPPARAPRHPGDAPQPEVITESLHSKAADVYSFGVVLWELLACAKPYHGMHYAQIVHSIAQNKVCMCGGSSCLERGAAKWERSLCLDCGAANKLYACCVRRAAWQQVQ